MNSSGPVFGDDFSQAVADEIPSLYRYALSLVGDAENAEWLVSDTLSRAWEKWGSFRHEAGLKTWLHRILHNLAVDTARRKSREVSVGEIEDQWRDDTFSVDPEVVVEMAEDREELKDSLLRLPFVYRSVVLLHDMEQWKLAEIAAALEISLPAAKQRLRRGRMMLVSALSEGAVRRAANVGVPPFVLGSSKHCLGLFGRRTVGNTKRAKSHRAPCPLCNLSTSLCFPDRR